MMWWVGMSQLVVPTEEFSVDFFLSSDATLTIIITVFIQENEWKNK